MKITATLATALLSGLASANVGITWSIKDVPSSGLKDITFPISVENAPHKDGFYFAQQFEFYGIDHIGYTGLQPRPDYKNGTSKIHAVFSSFAEGTTTSNDNCKNGADGGSGVSCAIDLPVDNYDHPYQLAVKNTKGTTWTGTLIDTVTHEKSHIGSYTLGSKAGGIKSYYLGFVEYYPFNSGHHSCDELPYTNATFGTPFTGTPGAGKGKLEKPYTYSTCQEAWDLRIDSNQDGYNVAVGSEHPASS